MNSEITISFDAANIGEIYRKTQKGVK